MAFTLVPMSAADFAAWWAIIVPAYVADKVATGTAGAADSREKSRDSNTGRVTQGAATPGPTLTTLMPDDSPAGYRWLAEKAGGTFLDGLYVPSAFRRHGFGHRAMLAMDSLARDRGLISVSRLVFGFDHAATAPDRLIGDEETDPSLRKRLAALP